MGTARGSGRSPLAVDDSVWASEADGEEAVLAEFADEGSPDAREASAVAAEPASAQGARRGPRVLSAHTPMRDVVRTVLIGCLSAMALGASFAIGFGYVWSDRGSNVVPATAVDSMAPSPAAEPVPSTASTAAPTSSDAEVRGLPAAPTSAKREALAAPVGEAEADPGPAPAFGVPLPAAALEAEVVPELPAAAAPFSGAGETLPSQPMLSAAESALMPEPISPEPPPRAASSAARVVEIVEPAPSPAVRSELDAVREAIDRYQAAYTQKDVGAMALVWPSVDVAGVARAFDDVGRQALTFDECRVSTAGKFATAVCPGQVRYVGRVGSRQVQERHGTWTIALERNGDAWQFTRLNVR